MGVEFAKPESDEKDSAAKTKPSFPVPKPVCGQTWKRGQQKLCRVKEQEEQEKQQARRRQHEEESEDGSEGGSEGGSKDGSEGESYSPPPFPQRKPRKPHRPEKIESVPLTSKTTSSARISPCDILYVFFILFLHRLKVSTSLQATVVIVACCTCALVGYGLAPRCDCFGCLHRA